MTACKCAACRGDVAPVSFSRRHADAFNAKMRAILGKPALSALDGLPADMQAFVGGL